MNLNKENSEPVNENEVPQPQMSEFEAPASSLEKETHFSLEENQRKWRAGLLAFFIIALAVLSCIVASSGDVDSLLPTSTVEKSTVKREPVHIDSIQKTDFIVDELDWIKNHEQAEKGISSFYAKTGVYPMLILTNNINGNPKPTSDEVNAYLNTVYNEESIPDQGHIVVVFLEREHGDYAVYIRKGTDAEKCMDDEACEILKNYFSALYYSDRNREKYVSDVFSKTAKRIMQVTPSPLKIIIICFGAVFVLICIQQTVHNKRKHKSLNADQTKQILETTLRK